MTATNKAFIEAYGAMARKSASSSATPTSVADCTPSASNTLLGSSELVLATTDIAAEPLTVTAIAESTATTTQASKRPAPRRPLSQLQAEDLFGFDKPRSASRPATSALQWPPRCQQLLGLAADRYDALLRQAPTATNSALMGVVGAGPQSGCTTTAICLALRSSALGFRTALVEGDFTSGGLAKALKLSEFTCWSTALTSETAVATTVIATGDVGVDLLLTKPHPEGELDSTARFRASLAAGALRRNYQRVVVDLGCPANGKSYPSADLAAALGVDMVVGVTAPHTTDEVLDSTNVALAEYGLKFAGLLEAV